MADKPIVSRLQVNLSWKAWLKPFFIHPSVTEAAKDNMKQVRKMAQEQQEAKERQAAKISSDNKVLTLLNDISVMLDDEDHREEKNQIALIRRSVDSNETRTLVKQAWSVVHSIKDKNLRAALRLYFEPLQIAEYDLCIAIDAAISDVIIDADLRSRFESAFARIDYESYHLSHLSSAINELNYVELQEKLNKLVGAYSEKKIAAVLSRETHRASDGLTEPAVVPAVTLRHIFQGSFLKTYGLDGYESSSTELVDAQGNVYSYDRAKSEFSAPASVPFSLAIMTFLGFPTRLQDGKANHSFRTIVRNLFGGWDSLNNEKSESWFWWLSPKNYTFQGKRLWNVLLLPIKLVIFAVKIATIPFKFALNVLKFVTEFLPEVILNYSAIPFGWASSGLLAVHYDDKMKLGQKIIAGIIFALVFIVSAPIHYAARLLALVGTALTSPEKSARSAWNYARSLNSRWGYVFAIIGAALSVALTASLWAVAFPFVFAEAVALVPALGAIVATIAQWPIVAATLAYVNGAAVFVAGTLPAAFSLVATALSTALGVSVSATVLAAATTVAFIVAPVVSIMTRVLDGLSNVWTKWEARSPLLIANSSREEVSVLQTIKMSLKSSPSASATSYVRLDEIHSGDAKAASHLVDERAETKQPYFAQTPTVPAPGIDWEEPRPDYMTL